MPPASTHVAGPIRDEFLRVCDKYATGEIDAAEVLLMVEKLWNCSNTLPSNTCDMLALPHRSTYADAARRLLAAIRKS